MRHFSAKVVTLCVAAGLGGCGVPRELRDGANLTSAYTATVQKELEQFARQRDAIAQARVRNAGMLETSALTGEQMGVLDVTGWRIAGDSVRLRLYDGILAATNQTAEAQRAAAAQRAAYTKAAEAARGGVVARSADLARAAQSLATLAKKPNPKGEIEFYISFFKQVRNDLDSLQAAAKKDSAAAVAGADTAKKAVNVIP